MRRRKLFPLAGLFPASIDHCTLIPMIILFFFFRFKMAKKVQSNNYKIYLKSIVQNITTWNGIEHFNQKKGKSFLLWSAFMIANVILTICFIFFVLEAYNKDQILTKVRIFIIIWACLHSLLDKTSIYQIYYFRTLATYVLQTYLNNILCNFNWARSTKLFYGINKLT